MWLGSSPRPRSGRRAGLLCCHRPDRGADGHRPGSNATASTSRSASRRWLSLPKEAWQTVAWREGSAERLSSRFARQRVRPAHRDAKLSQPRAEEWLLIEWTEHETVPTKYWFATLPEDIDLDRLDDLAKLRWRK